MVEFKKDELVWFFGQQVKVLKDKTIRTKFDHVHVDVHGCTVGVQNYLLKKEKDNE